MKDRKKADQRSSACRVHTDFLSERDTREDHVSGTHAQTQRPRAADHWTANGVLSFGMQVEMSQV